MAKPQQRRSHYLEVFCGAGLCLHRWRKQSQSNHSQFLAVDEHLSRCHLATMSTEQDRWIPSGETAPARVCSQRI